MLDPEKSETVKLSQKDPVRQDKAMSLTLSYKAVLELPVLLSWSLSML